MPTPRINPWRLRIRCGETGSALIVVLWISALLAAMATGFSISMRTESQAVWNLVENIRVRALADAAVQRGVSDLLNISQETPPLLDGTAAKFSFGGGELSVSIQSERGKVDLNKAPLSFLKGILREAGMTREKADSLGDSIADWRDEDSFRRLNGAEAQDYRSAKLTFEPTNAPFRTVAELQQVVGVDPILFKRLSPLFTVHSFIEKIAPNYAPRSVLAAIPGVNMMEVESLVAVRENNKYTELNTLLPALSGVSEWISKGSGSVYTIKGSAILPSGAQFLRDVVVWIPTNEGDRFWILDERIGSTPDTMTDAAK